MEAGEWALVVGGLGLLVAMAGLRLEMRRMRDDERRFAAGERRLDDAEARLAAQEEVNSLSDLKMAIRLLYDDAWTYLRPGNGSYATERSLRALLTETRQLAGEARGDVSESALLFVETCGRVITWIESGASEEEKDSLRRAVEDAFEAANGAVIARRESLRRGGP